MPDKLPLRTKNIPFFDEGKLFLIFYSK